MNFHYNGTAEEGDMYAPAYPQAFLFPALSFPAWILCFPSMVWHFRQVNVAAGSAILWIILHNFFNSINALIWPRDNLTQWWDGSVWCDIHVRLQVGSYVGLAASAAIITRKLAKVMDTRNITVSSSRSSKIREKIWELLWCWGAPLILIIVYYVAQPARYMLYGIVGCLPAYDTSWPSIVLSIMWFPITMAFATYWAVLLVYRLYRYRREFQRLVATQNTTQSRFIRLFILSMILSLVYLTYSIYITIAVSLVATDPYSWSFVHDPIRFNTILRVPAHGQVALDKWIQVATGYLTFALFGTGVDAHNLYKKMLVSVGMGRLWPSLYELNTSGDRTPSSFIAARSWTSGVGGKAKNVFWSSVSKTTNKSTMTSTGGDSFTEGSRTNSVGLDSMSPALHRVTTEDALMERKQQHRHHHHHSTSESNTDSKPQLVVPTPAQASWFKQWFPRPNRTGPLLPLFNRGNNVLELNTPNNTSTLKPSTASPRVQAYAWAAEDTSAGRTGQSNAVHVVREVHQDHHARRDSDKEDKPIDAWA